MATTDGAQGEQGRLIKQAGGNPANRAGRSGADLMRDVLHARAGGTAAVNAKLSGADVTQKGNDTVVAS